MSLTGKCKIAAEIPQSLDEYRNIRSGDSGAQTASARMAALLQYGDAKGRAYRYPGAGGNRA